MKKLFLFIVPVLASLNLYAQPKVVAECTVNFTITVTGEGSSPLNNAAKTLYIKGRQSRVDIVAPSFKQSVIYDNNADVAVILREIGNDKYISTLDSVKWKEQNKQYDGMTVALTNETKTILGYECKKAIATLKNGNVFTMYYATAITPSATENPYQFKNLPGFVLEYESQPEGSKQKITYTANKINLNPVPVATFEIPTKGYRILQ
ncbi:GLPGLI family protein [Foetidibacter luteolus]|uniref:GLPGLI family protein n=1 Tax=Foetidibacter luteolus TaxID=2608880 RepID=UPI00129BFB9F|nr:GLPGLI family protein [Foetidibacter luteolus]